MYDVALTVEACLRAGTRVDLAWVVQTHGFSSRERAEALAITPGGGRVGSLLSGALDDQLADRATQRSDPRIVDLTSARWTRWSPGCPAAATRAAC